MRQESKQARDTLEEMAGHVGMRIEKRGSGPHPWGLIRRNGTVARPVPDPLKGKGTTENIADEILREAGCD